MRITVNIKTACLRLLRIPIIGFAAAYIFATVFGSEPGSALFFGVLGGVLLYIPLLGLLYFESKNWIELRDDGLYVKTSDFDDFLSWSQILSIKTSRDALMIISEDSEQKILLYFIDPADKHLITRAHFEHAGLRPNDSAFANRHPGYLNWDGRK